MPKMFNRPYLMMLLLLVVSLGACTSFKQRDNELQSTATKHWLYGETAQSEEVLMLLSRLKELDGLPADQLKAAYKSTERIFNKQPTMSARLQLAWLLAMKNTGFQDIPRAAKLLAIKKRKGGQKQQPNELDGLRYLISRMVKEQKLQQDKYQQVVAALNEERKISQQLTVKIEDLTQIEESMIQRKPLPEAQIR